MKKTLKIIFFALVVLFIYAPILVLAVYSFTDSANIGPIHNFSLKNYKTLFTSEELTGMITGTVFLAFGSAIIATILGTLGALGAFTVKSFQRWQ